MRVPRPSHGFCNILGRYVAFENEEGSVQEYSVDGSGVMRETHGGAAATHGAHCCYLANMRNMLLCANYSDGQCSVVAMPLLPSLAPAPTSLRIKFPGGNAFFSSPPPSPPLQPSLPLRRQHSLLPARPPGVRALPLLCPPPPPPSLRRLRPRPFHYIHRRHHDVLRRHIHGR